MNPISRSVKRSLRLILMIAFIVELNGCAHTPPTTRTASPTSPETRPTSSTETAPTATTVTTDTAPPAATEPGAPFEVRMRYVDTTNAQIITATEPLVVTTPDQGLKRLPEGRWQIRHRTTRRATIVHPVYAKAFAHNETRLLAEERQRFRDQGYSTFVTTMGRSVTSSKGVVYDGRKYWLGIDRCATEQEAARLKEKLRGQKVWAWTRPEIQRPSEGTLTFHDGSGKAVLLTPTPVRVRSAGAVALEDARAGKAPIEVSGPFDMELDRDGHLAVLGELPIEDYLKGILPAEMYPSWPLEALKAQAVAARSEIIAHAGGKHYFDGFDFCIEQHCRAYAGDEGRHARTDQAVKETTALVLTDGDNAIVPTVFSANCGGWTENNENVWDGAPAPALRGRSDHHGRYNAQGNRSVEKWIGSKPDSFCAHDGQYYRWSRSLSLTNLSKRLNSQYGIGTLTQVKALERGVSGRLKAVQLVGSRKTVTVRKELNIRRAFENLPSALCTFSVDRRAGVLHVRGAGRGHGVGLCQQGACGMAQAAQQYDAILLHYFQGVKISHI